METDIERLTPGVSGRLKGKQTSLDAAAEHYLHSKTKTEGDGNYSHTAAAALTEFVDQMLKQNAATTGQLDKHDLTHYASHLKTEVARPDTERQFSAESAHTYYNIVSGFLTWAVRRDLLDTNYAQKDVATSELPTASGSEKQQYWSEDTRENLLLYVDWKTEDVIRNGWMDEEIAVRDRAFIGVLALTGARIGELLRSPQDGRRSGLTWRKVDYDEEMLHVLGKSQALEEVPLLNRAARWLRAHERRLDPPTDAWPVFPTKHAPTLYQTARDGLRRKGHASEEIESLLENNDVDELLREHEIPPPAITTEAGRQLVADLSRESHIREDGEVLEPHGARRGVGQAYYMQAGHESAQKVLRHQDPEVTSKQYSHLETSELREAGERILGDERRSNGTDSEASGEEADEIPETYK